MRKVLIGILAAAGSLAVATPALALCTSPGGTVGGAAAGAATGAVVGGPVGAAVGGVIGGTVGAHALPPTSCSYVVETQVEPVVIQQEVVVGQPLPQTVVLHPIPATDQYVFAYVNQKRVIVDPRTRVVVEVVAN